MVMKTMTTKRICQKFVRYNQSEIQSETTVVYFSESTVPDEYIAKGQFACILQGLPLMT